MQTRWLPAALQFAIQGILLWATMSWLGAANQLLYIWPMTAIQLSFVLPSWRNRPERYTLLAAGAAGELIACLALHFPLWLCLFIPLAQAIETSLIAAYLSRTIIRFEDLKTRANVVRFTTAAILVPATFGWIAAIPGSVLTHQSLVTSWKIIAPSDALGIAVIFPATLFLISGEYRSIRKIWPHLVSAGHVLIIFLISTIVIFTQPYSPFLFLTFPPLVLVVLALGLEGSVISVPILTVIACFATARGYGPISHESIALPEQRILSLQIFLLSASGITLAIGALFDEHRNAGRAADEARTVYETLIENSDDMIIFSTLDGTRRFISPAVKHITGMTPEEFLALGPLEVVHPADRDLAGTILESLTGGKLNHTFRFRVLCKDGSYRWVESHLNGYVDAETTTVSGYVATVRDISAQLQAEHSWQTLNTALALENKQLANLAAHDELTSIPNRRAFNLTLESEVARHSRSDKPLSLILIDVDYFKKYNDHFGHPAGDTCLQTLAHVMESSVARAADLAARIGGEEFAILLPSTPQAGAISVARNIQSAISALRIGHPASPFGYVTVSIGVATWPPTYYAEPTLLMQQADRALYESKRLGRSQISVWKDFKDSAESALAG